MTKYKITRYQAILLTLLILALAIATAIGFAFGAICTEPEVVTVTEYETVKAAPIVEYQTITITPETEIITEYVYVPIDLKYPESVDTMNDYVQHWVKTRLFKVANDAPNKCWLWANALQQRGMRDGLLFNIETGGYHAKNSVIILNDTMTGGEVWYIEPQTGETWFYAPLG